MKINIRTIQPSDNAILAKIIRSCFHDFEVKCTAGTVYTDPTTDDLYSLFQTPKSQLWVAEANDKIVGCCGIFPTENLPEGCTELVKFYISNEGRGKGASMGVILPQGFHPSFSDPPTMKKRIISPSPQSSQSPAGRSPGPRPGPGPARPYP